MQCGAPRTDPISVGPVNVASWSARQSARDDLRSEKGKGERTNERMNEWWRGEASSACMHTTHERNEMKGTETV